MNKTKYIIFLITINFLTSCGKKTDLSELLEFDNHIRENTLLEHFSQHRINKTLQANHFKSDTLSPTVLTQLQKINITKSEYGYLKDRMLKLGLDDYYRTEEYSVYFQGGSFAKKYGLIINHTEKSISHNKEWIGGRYDINVGEEIRNSIHTFWTD